MAHYTPERRLPSSSYPSSMQPSSSSSVFWRQPQHNAHVVQQPSLDDYSWHDPPHEPWSSSYVSYTAAPDYVDPAPAALTAEYLHPSLAAAADPFADASRTRSASAHPQASAADTPRLEAASWATTTDLYRFEPDPDPHPSSAHAPSPSPPSPRVKQEEIPADEFVFEVSVAAAPAPVIGLARHAHQRAHQFAPMTEVPLRAVNACKSQRVLMSSFRLDPFAMHNGQHGAAVKTGSYACHVGPLTEPPLIFEFQLDLPGLKAEDGAEDIEPAPAPRGGAARLSRLASPSPSLESESDALQYPLADSPREDSRWPASPGPYALSAGEPDAFEPILTPAQSLWQMNYQPERDGSAYSLSPPASLHSAEHASPYLPPLKPLRPTYADKSACAQIPVQAQAHSHAHAHAHSHPHVQAHAPTAPTHQRLLPVPAATPRAVYDFPSIAPPADEAYPSWGRKTFSLAMFCTQPKNMGGEGGGLGSGLSRMQSGVAGADAGADADSIPLSSPRWSTMAMRRAAAQGRGASRYAVAAR